MLRTVTLFILISISSGLLAQHRVKFILQEKTAIKHDSIYIVGSFNGWDSLANPNYLMKPVGPGIKEIELVLDQGTIAYKFHSGNWFNVEKAYEGGEIRDRRVTILKDTVLVDSVEAWRDELIIDKKLALERARKPVDQVSILAGITINYAFNTEYTNIDSAFHYALKAIDLQQQIVDNGETHSREEDMIALGRLKEVVASLLHSLGNYPRSLELRLQNVALAESSGNRQILCITLGNLMEDFMAIKDYSSALHHGRRAEAILKGQADHGMRMTRLRSKIYYQIALSHFHLNAIDSALIYAEKSSQLLTDSFNIISFAYTNLLLADIYAATGSTPKALDYYQKVVKESPSFAPQIIAKAKTGLARVYQNEGMLDLALSHATQALTFFQNNTAQVQSWGENSATYLAELSPLMASLHQSNGNSDSAYYFLQLSVNLKDSLYNIDRVRQFQTLAFNDSARRKQLAREKRTAERRFKTRVKLYGLIFGIVGALLLAVILYKNNRQKQHANTKLKKQNDEIEQTLEELKTMQSQLIQAEKMASLGELTAGIAHEIQNPLNFVNNFSEVSNELIAEASEEIRNGDPKSTQSILSDLSQNLEKISYHGQRASSIVRGMLDHSRSSAGKRIPTDINQLCDEYLRLAYHAYFSGRQDQGAKNKNARVKYETDFQEDIPKIEVVAHDIGRVILNLVNNALQAMSTGASVEEDSDRQKKESLIKGEKGTVRVTTKKFDDHVQIIVADEGPGIPEEIRDKIFQPFFTTKPAGQGPGLGLSIGYDIVKAHGGELTVSSEEGKGTEFTVTLPIN